jgi:hypothetical protein
MDDELFFNPERSYANLRSFTLPSMDIVGWCDECKRWHRHGGGEGHRTAHCGRKSAYSSSGYILKVEGPAPKSVIADLKLKRQKGPAALDVQPDRLA